jgi:SMC interacting uncharacterized protein involved in chromosome segregation
LKKLRRDIEDRDDDIQELRELKKHLKVEIRERDRLIQEFENTSKRSTVTVGV